MSRYKILITGPAWIGDMVMAQSLFKYLHNNNPQLILDVLAPAWTLPLLERMPEVRKGIAFSSRHGKLDLMMRIRTGLQLKTEHYNEAIIIPRSLKSAIPSWVAGIKKRTGFNSHFGLINYPRTYNPDRQQLFVRRHLSLVTDDAYSLSQESIPEPKLHVDTSRSDSLLDTFGLNRDEFVAFAPGAEFGPSKQWPAKHFAQLANGLNEKGLRCILIGSGKDNQVAEKIVELSDAKNIINLCGKTTLLDVIDIVAAAKCAVTNDSGLMHLSYASGARLVAIYGSTSADYTPPLSLKSIILQKKLSCQPCFERTCRFGHYDCMTQVTPEEVLNSKFLNMMN